LTAFPMIARCMELQLAADAAQLAAAAARMLPVDATLVRPNLVLRTGPTCTDGCDGFCDDESHHGLDLPILSVREG
jgi:hypothetical protein